MPYGMDYARRMQEGGRWLRPGVTQGLTRPYAGQASMTPRTDYLTRDAMRKGMLQRLMAGIAGVEADTALKSAQAARIPQMTPFETALMGAKTGALQFGTERGRAMLPHETERARLANVGAEQAQEFAGDLHQPNIDKIMAAIDFMNAQGNLFGSQAGWYGRRGRPSELIQDLITKIAAAQVASLGGYDPATAKKQIRAPLRMLMRYLEQTGELGQ